MSCKAPLTNPIEVVELFLKGENKGGVMKKAGEEQKNREERKSMLIVTSRYPKFRVPLNGDKWKEILRGFLRRNRRALTRVQP